MSETSQPSSENDGKSHRPHGSRRRQVHNEVERRRKDKINGWITKIAELLPGKELNKPSKINILEQTVDYIKLLVSERNKLISENCSEVQAVEIKKLKRDLQIISEQNALYEKLLQQSNISLNTLPKKTFKYSNKFVRKNGVLTTKNTESDVSTYVDSAIQVGNDMCLNIPVTVNCSISLTCESSKVSSVTSKSTKTVIKPAASISKPVKILSAVTTNCVAQSCAPINSLQSNSPVNTALVTQTIHQSNNISQENVIPIINWNDPSRNSASAHTGGVTTVLSQFPVMSTTLGSSFSNVYNKNVPTFIIPTGGNILQHFPSEKPSNTISIICPSTLPILLPQQVLSVPSIARNVGLPPTIICPGLVNNNSSQAEKSTLGSTLLTINSSSMVPISSSLSANTQIILPSQPTVLGNACSNVNMTHNIISPLLTAVSQSDDLIVPLVQKQPVSPPTKTTQGSTNTGDNSCRNNIAKADNSETKTVENALETNKDIHVIRSLPLSTHIESKSSKISEHNMPKKRTIEDSRQLCLTAPLSLQLLSANKIISLASQSQNYKKRNPKKETVAKTVCKSLQVNESKPNKSSDSFCIQTDETLVQETRQTKRNESFENRKKNSTLTSDLESSQNSDPSMIKSNFSLTVLMADSSSDKTSSLNNKNSKLHQNSPSLMQDNLSALQVESSTSANVAYVNNSTESVLFPSISDSQMVSSVTKENEFESSVQILSNASDSRTNQDVQKVATSSSKTIISSDESFSNNTTNETVNSLPTTISTSEMEANTISTFNSLVISNTVINTPPGNVDTNIVSKQNSETPNFSIKNNVQPERSVNIMQNNHGQSNMCSEITNSVNNAFNENVPYTINESNINQSLLPSLFSSNQIVSLNSPVLVCHTGQENGSGILLPHGIQVSNESTNQSLNHCLMHNSHTDYQTFSVLNKDLMLSNSVTTITGINDHNKSSANSGANNILDNDCSKIDAVNNKIESAPENDCEKQFITPKKKNKSSHKESKMNTNDKNVSSSEVSSEVSNNTVINKIHSIDNISSFTKSDASICSRQDSNFIFTSDILARATESIFGNDILESPHMPKRNESCFPDDASNLNVPVTTSEKILDINYKMPYNGVRVDHSTSEASTENNNKKNNQGGDLLQSDIATTAHTIQNDIRNVQEVSPKQSKLCRTKKSKSGGDSEPPCKKIKEMPPASEKSNGHTFSVSHQSDKINEKNISTIHSNLSFLEKQVSSPSQTSVDDQTGVGSMGNFANQIHLSDNSCKTPSSVDAMFSLTPMLGDILKDVSHNALDSRSANFVTGNENQSVFSSEKNFISFNYSNNSNEDYLNLPRMYFPIIPEISSTPVVHVTTVSFAHSVSLCSTQSDSQKVAETHTTSDSQSKSNSKKREVLPLFHNSHNLDLTSASGMSKQSECVMKTNDSEPQFVTPVKAANTSVQFEGHHPNTHSQSLSSIHSTNLAVSHSGTQYNARDNFVTPVSHSISFYPTISSSSNIQNYPCTTTSLSHGAFQNSLSNVGTTSISFPALGNTSSSFNSQPTLSKPDNLSHSLCSLLKENSNISENRGGTSVVSSQSATPSSNIAQSKYSALSLISDQTSYSESVSTTTCHPQFVQSSTVYTTSGSDGQYISTVSSCSRNPKTSLSYSAESLLQTSCANTEKNKNNKNNNRFQLRTPEKKTERNAITNMHGISDTNIFMPVTSCDINIQNAPLVPLPPVTSFHNFSSAYTVCDTAPSTTIFNSGTRNQDIPLSLSNDNFLNHMNLNVESQMLSNRHEVSPTVPKPHSNITLPFENHNSLYNNCNFLPHVKPALENSRSSEAPACFQPSSYCNNYSQQSQKPNCCHFSHRAVASNSDISSDINLSVSGVPSFHEKNNQPNRSGLQPSFSQSNSNFMGNFFYNTPASCHDGNERNDLNVKPSTIRTSQEMFVPDGVRQSIHDQNVGIIFNSRKTVPSNRTKSKKPKNITSNENIVIPTCIANYSSSQDSSCNKVNISYVPNGYFKSSSHPVLPPPSQIQCSQNKMTDAMSSAVIPANPSFNPVLHQQSDNFLNLNFQHPNFTMSPLPRPPTQPLSCSCLTTPIISHTFSSSTPHPVPNFNLSNILPDMGCSGNQVSFSPAKFPVNHSLSSSSSQCQTNSTITNSAHIVSHQSCTPSLYPPHPPMVRGTLNPILGHNSQSLIEGQVPLVGTAGSVMSQNTTFTATQNPTFRNVIHPITFPRNDR